MNGKNFLVHFLHNKLLRKCAARYFHGKLLDIGCGGKPYLSWLRPIIDSYLGFDLPDSAGKKRPIDVGGNALKLPFKDGSFDSVLCTSVLEHLEEPEIALKECFRVLKPGGCAIYSVPLLWHVHEDPRDFFRFTSFGLEHLAGKGGFRITYLKALSGFWVTFGQLLVYQIYRLHEGWRRFVPVIPVLSFIILGGSYLLDCLDRNERCTFLYLLVIQKPQEGSDYASSQDKIPHIRSE